MPVSRSDENFRNWLGPNRDALYDKLPSVEKLKLARQYESAPAQSPSDTLTRELTVRYGSPDKAPALDRSRLERLNGNNAIAPNPAVPDAGQMAILRGLSSERRLAAYQALQSAISLRGLASRGGREGDEAQRQLDALARRFPVGLI